MPFRICLGKSGLGVRQQSGFDTDEFRHLELLELDGSVTDALNRLEARANWHQLFGSYQTLDHIKAALAAALKSSYPVAIASEAPCNMFKPSLKRTAKAIYFSAFAKKKFAHVVDGADFILNWSGDDATTLLGLGWQDRKIVPVGYFPPPLTGSSFIERTQKFREPFRILCTGNMTWHRGPDVLMKALVLLKEWGVPVSAVFTSAGPLSDMIRRTANKHDLDCKFPGFVGMKELIELYQSCSLFVAPGRAEPWGMRVNDALNSGAPIVISRGMGAHKLVNEYGVGATFAAEDHVDLAWQIRRLAIDGDAYQWVNRNLARHKNTLMPHAAAERVASWLLDIAPEWVPARSA